MENELHLGKENVILINKRKTEKAQDKEYTSVREKNKPAEVEWNFLVGARKEYFEKLGAEGR